MRTRPILLAGFGAAIFVLTVVLWPAGPSQDLRQELPPEAQAAERYEAPASRAQRVVTGVEPVVSPAAPAPDQASSGNQQGFDAPEAPEAPSGENASPRTCRMVPVLPTVTDVTINSCSGSLNFADVLNRELKDPSWASDMEARIRGVIGGAEGLALARLEVECRMTSCGILLVHADGSDPGRQQDHATEILRDAVGFQQWGGTAVSATSDGKAFSMVGLMRATGRERLWPAPPSIAALPGVAGVEVPLLGIAAIDDAHPAKRLAEEADRPEWSRPMESRLIREVSAAAPQGWYQSYVECRQTTCGLVLLYPPATSVDVKKVEDSVGEVLGLSGGGGRSYEQETGTVATIYLHR